MKIRKKAQRYFEKSSVFTLSKMGKNFLINKSCRNTAGEPVEKFVIIDKDLKDIAATAEYKGYISISQVFPCEDGSRFLVYNADPYILLYGDFSENIMYTVDVTDIEYKYFLPICKWDADNVVLITSEDEFYNFDILEKKLSKITEVSLKETYRDLYDLLEKTHSDRPMGKADFINQTYIYFENYLSDGPQNIVYVDLKNNKRKSIEDPYNNYHDVIFHQGYFIIVAEDVLTIVKDKKAYKYPMRDKYYIFGRVVGIDDDNKLSFMALECSKRDDTENRLVRYELS